MLLRPGNIPGSPCITVRPCINICGDCNKMMRTLVLWKFLWQNFEYAFQPRHFFD